MTCEQVITTFPSCENCSISSETHFQEMIIEKNPVCMTSQVIHKACTTLTDHTISTSQFWTPKYHAFWAFESHLLDYQYHHLYRMPSLEEIPSYFPKEKWPPVNKSSCCHATNVITSFRNDIEHIVNLKDELICFEFPIFKVYSRVAHKYMGTFFCWRNQSHLLFFFFF